MNDSIRGSEIINFNKIYKETFKLMTKTQKFNLSSNSKLKWKFKRFSRDKKYFYAKLILESNISRTPRLIKLDERVWHCSKKDDINFMIF